MMLLEEWITGCCVARQFIKPTYTPTQPIKSPLFISLINATCRNLNVVFLPGHDGKK